MRHENRWNGPTEPAAVTSPFAPSGSLQVGEDVSAFRIPQRPPPPDLSPVQGREQSPLRSPVRSPVSLESDGSDLGSWFRRPQVSNLQSLDFADISRPLHSPTELRMRSSPIRLSPRWDVSVDSDLETTDVEDSVSQLSRHPEHHTPQLGDYTEMKRPRMSEADNSAYHGPKTMPPDRLATQTLVRLMSDTRTLPVGPEKKLPSTQQAGVASGESTTRASGVPESVVDLDRNLEFRRRPRLNACSSLEKPARPVASPSVDYDVPRASTAQYPHHNVPKPSTPQLSHYDVPNASTPQSPHYAVPRAYIRDQSAHYQNVSVSYCSTEHPTEANPLGLSTLSQPGSIVKDDQDSRELKRAPNGLSLHIPPREQSTGFPGYSSPPPATQRKEIDPFRHVMSWDMVLPISDATRGPQNASPDSGLDSPMSSLSLEGQGDGHLPEYDIPYAHASAHLSRRDGPPPLPKVPPPALSPSPPVGFGSLSAVAASMSDLDALETDFSASTETSGVGILNLAQFEKQRPKDNHRDETDMEIERLEADIQRETDAQNKHIDELQQDLSAEEGRVTVDQDFFRGKIAYISRLMEAATTNGDQAEICRLVNLLQFCHRKIREAQTKR